MRLLEKLHTLIILIAVIVGLLAGQVKIIEVHAEKLIVPFLVLMLYGLFLAIPVKDLKRAFVNARFAAVSMAINFIWTPFLAFGLGAIFLSDHPALWIGFTMLMVTPCTDWYLAFTAMAKGNLTLSAAILPLNLVLQLLLLPLYLLLFSGVIKIIPLAIIFESIVLVVAAPFLFAGVTRFTMNKLNKQKVLERKILPFFSGGQVLFLAAAIFSMFASQGRCLLDNISVTCLLLAPVALFFLINFVAGRAISYVLNFPYEDSASLSLTTLARNSPLALAIAVTAFPEEPLVALALTIGPLIELPLLTVFSRVLLKIRSGSNRMNCQKKGYGSSGAGARN